MSSAEAARLLLLQQRNHIERYRLEEERFIRELQSMLQTDDVDDQRILLESSTSTVSSTCSNQSSTITTTASVVSSSDASSSSSAHHHQMDHHQEGGRPVLGAICALLTQIGQLHDENSQLRSRLDRPPLSYTHTNSLPTAVTASIVKQRRSSTIINAAANNQLISRVSALLDAATTTARRRSTNANNTNSSSLPSKTSVMGGKKKKSALPAPTTTIRNGANDRLLTPSNTNKNSLTASTYSSTDASSSLSRSQSSSIVINEQQSPNCIDSRQQLVTDVMVDSDEQPVFTEVALPTYDSNRLRRPTTIRHGQQSTNCIATSRDPSSETMTASRSSFLEKIGIKKRIVSTKDQQQLPIPTKVELKKRKRKISESDSMASAETIQRRVAVTSASRIVRSNAINKGQQQQQQQQQQRQQQLKENSKNDTVIEKSTRKVENLLPPSYVLRSEKGAAIKRSWLSHPKSKHIIDEIPSFNQQQSNSDTNIFDHHHNEQQQRYFDISDDDNNATESRQPTIIYCDPTNDDDENDDVNQRTTPTHSIDTVLHLIDAECHNSASPISHDIIQFPDKNDRKIETNKSRISSTIDDSIENFASDVTNQCNRRLIEQLFRMQDQNAHLVQKLNEKSIEYERITAQLDGLERQVCRLKGKFQLDSTIERLTLQQRLSIIPDNMINDLEQKIIAFDGQLREFKIDNAKVQQNVYDAFNREQTTSQQSLDHIEKLQRINFRLIQQQIKDTIMSSYDLRQIVDTMPSYETLYTFTMNVLRKLRQLRSSLVEKTTILSRVDLELIQAQSSLLITHAQIERQKLMLQLMDNNGQRQCGHNRLPRRRFSYHGDDLLDRLIKPQLSFYLPFKLHGKRLVKMREHTDTTIDAESNIEDEFLRLFSCANVVPSSTHHESNHRHHDTDEMIPVRESIRQSQITDANHSMPSSRFSSATVDIINQTSSIQQQRRPISLIEKSSSSEVRRIIPEIEQKQVVSNTGNNTGTQSIGNNLNLHKLGNYGHVKSIVSSLQDVSSTSSHRRIAMRPPTTSINNVVKYRTGISSNRHAIVTGTPRSSTDTKSSTNYITTSRYINLPPNYQSSSNRLRYPSINEYRSSSQSYLQPSAPIQYSSSKNVDSPYEMVNFDSTPTQAPSSNKCSSLIPPRKIFTASINYSDVLKPSIVPVSSSDSRTIVTAPNSPLVNHRNTNISTMMERMRKSIANSTPVDKCQIETIREEPSSSSSMSNNNDGDTSNVINVDSNIKKRQSWLTKWKPKK